MISKMVILYTTVDDLDIEELLNARGFAWEWLGEDRVICYVNA